MDDGWTMKHGLFEYHALINVVPSGKQPHSYGKIHHWNNGKIHYFYGHFQ